MKVYLVAILFTIGLYCQGSLKGTKATAILMAILVVSSLVHTEGVENGEEDEGFLSELWDGIQRLFGMGGFNCTHNEQNTCPDPTKDRCVNPNRGQWACGVSEKECGPAGMIWCPDVSCDASLKRLCGQAQLTTLAECTKCTGDNQLALQQAGCTATDIAGFCKGGECTDVFKKSCPLDKQRNIGDCMTCVGEHQHEFEELGCSQDDIFDYCKEWTPVAPPGGIPIGDQEESTIQIVNNTTVDYFNVFILSQDATKIWKKVGGSGTIAEMVNWKIQGGGTSWEPLGAEFASQIQIPTGGYIELKNPQPYKDPGPGQAVKNQFKIIPMRLKTNKILKTTDDVQNHKSDFIYTQSPFTIEAGEHAVGNVSGVNGINYRMKYEMTTKDAQQKDVVQTMTTNENPCQMLDSKYHFDVGCASPFIKDCKDFQDGNDAKSTCNCKAGTQNCKFNQCSDLLFNIPPELVQYKTAFDGGLKNNPPEPVKLFINDSTNLKKDSPQLKYCESIQKGNGDFDTYCYDYNDTNSSPTLFPPYNIKVTFSELVAT